MKYADKIGEHQASEKQGQHSRFGGRRALRTAFLVAVIAALLAITIFAIGRYTSIFDSLNIHTFSNGSEVTYNDTAEQGYLKVRYSYVPKGYKIVAVEESELMSIIEYQNDKKESIYSETILNEGTISGINTEGTTMRECFIGNQPATYVEASTGNMLIWVSGRYNTKIISDTVPVNELILMAESKHRKHFWEK
jgi:hypothetical protein